MTCGIYCIENIENGKKYIGYSVNIEDRWSAHVRKLKNKSHGNCILQKTFDKYGLNIFYFFIVEKLQRQFLKEKEIFYIEKWKTRSPNGYNLTDGGDGMLNPSNETRKKMSDKRRGSDNPHFGKLHSAETKNRISEKKLRKK